MPEAILLKDVENLGTRGSVVDVSKGYLRNYLDPAQARPAGDEGRHRRGRSSSPPPPPARRSRRSPHPASSPSSSPRRS